MKAGPESFDRPRVAQGVNHGQSRCRPRRDPEIRAVAQTLQRRAYGSDDPDQLQMASLGETWRDQEHQKFNGEFEQTMRQLARFAEAVDEQIPFLLRKAERLDEYLRQR